MNLSLKKYDVRTTTLLKNIILSFGIKGLGICISFFMMPAYIRFFDNQLVLGMWFTAISMLSWILNFDLGIGNGLRQHLVKPIVENDTVEIKKYISSAYISIGIIVLIIIILSYFITPIVNWHRIFNIDSEFVDKNTMVFMVRALFIGIMINFLLKLITSIMYAMNKSALPSLLSLATSIILLCYLSVGQSKSIEYNIKSLSIINILATNIPLLIASIILFKKKLVKSKPNLKFYSKKHTKEILTVGGIFFWLQIMTMIMFGTNEFLISKLVDPQYVVEFQIYNKLFTIICTLFNLAMTPVWSAVREACIKDDYDWIKKLYNKLNLLVLIFIPIQLVLVVILQPITDFWLGENTIEINIVYAILFLIYNVLYLKVSVDTSIVAGLGSLKVQSIALTLTTFIKLILSIIIISKFNSWIGIILSNILALIPYIIIEYFDIKIQMTGIKGRI